MDYLIDGHWGNHWEQDREEERPIKTPTALQILGTTWYAFPAHYPYTAAILLPDRCVLHWNKFAPDTAPTDNYTL